MGQLMRAAMLALALLAASPTLAGWPSSGRYNPSGFRPDGRPVQYLDPGRSFINDIDIYQYLVPGEDFLNGIG